MRHSSQLERLCERIREHSILDVADELPLSYSSRGKYRRCHCFMHDDQTPSMWLNTANDTWYCPVCCKGGDAIHLVMEHENLSYAEAIRWLAKAFNIPSCDDRTPFRPLHSRRRTSRKNVQTPPTMSTQSNTPSAAPQTLSGALINTCFSFDTPFCRALVSNQILTVAQMCRAALRYHLGKTRDGGVIFWMIDEQQRLLDGKIMFYRPDCHRDHDRHPSSVSYRLMRRGMLDGDWQHTHCLFGLHLLHELAPTKPALIAIVESEKSAIICSERVGGLWMATGGLSRLSPALLLPLKGHRIILFPDTDPDGTTYRQWLRLAREASELLGQPILVSDLLEKIATAEQKQRKIDLADLLIESSGPVSEPQN
ncbi:MAG: DUF6371 domain-containing protein [Akkermansia sp.]